MKFLPFYLSLLAILFQAIFSSSFLDEEGASLSTLKESSGSRPKKVVGKLVKRKSTTVKKLEGKKSKKSRKTSKAKDGVVKEDRPMLLAEMLPKELVKIVIDYFHDNFLYPIIVSKYSWTFDDLTKIAVDSARLYVLTDAEGIKGLDHSLANINEDKRRLIEFGDSEWFDYWRLSSSHDGRYVSFRHSHKVLIDQGEQTSDGTKWLMQSNEPDDRRPKRATFDGKDAHRGVLSRDGKTLYVNSYREMNPITRAYRVTKEAGTDPVALMKCELDGAARAVSGNGNRVMVVTTEQLEIHDISKDASKLVCQFDAPSFAYDCALNEDGSETAFYNGDKLRIVEVDKASGSAMDQSAIVPVKVSESLGWIRELVYSDGGKLHARHSGNIVSLFDPSTKELVLLDAPEEGQEVIDSAISPNADYIAFLRYVGKGENGKNIYETIVKRKLGSADFERLFGYKADEEKQAAKP